MASERREQLIEAALRLFCRDGFHATGIDRILREAGVAKMTLYHHFRSKEELILAALRRQDERFRNRFVRAVELRAVTPAERLLAAFDVLEGLLAEPDFRGCPMVKAAAEYADPGHPIHTTAAESKCLLRNYLAKLAADAGAEEPAELASQLALLLEGAIVLAPMTGEAETAQRARRAAQTLLAAALD